VIFGNALYKPGLKVPKEMKFEGMEMPQALIKGHRHLFGTKIPLLKGGDFIQSSSTSHDE